jgi:diaminohydroxyphosphoribosylaminopyrimidine deaminase/5-amino-6-(5-phosphoribosylamino)uracil reductase
MIPFNGKYLLLNHIKLMTLALEATWKTRGTTLPNPCVGALLAKNGKVVATASTQVAGGNHAERELLTKFNGRGHDLYVTLEPCCHHGKSPPCTEIIIASGIRKVFVALLDPNPLVAGKGIEALKNAGIKVEVGVAEELCQPYYQGFFHWVLNQKPYVVLKTAVSLDNFVAGVDGAPKAISGRKSKQRVHFHRALADVIIVGGNTIRKDKPKLDLRHSPFEKAQAHSTLVITRQSQLDLTGLLNPKLYQINPQESFAQQWDQLLTNMGKEGVHEVFVEAGPGLLKRILATENFQELILIQGGNFLKEGIVLDNPLEKWENRLNLSKFAQVESDIWFHYKG